MKKCNLTKNITYIAISIFSIVALSSVLYNMSKANPDYICIKDNVGTCTIFTNNTYPTGYQTQKGPLCYVGCENWTQNGTRECHGINKTQVAYYLVRTSCEEGYTKKSLGNNVGGESGRNSVDYIYNYECCQVTEQDLLAPVGTGSIKYN